MCLCETTLLLCTDITPSVNGGLNLSLSATHNQPLGIVDLLLFIRNQGISAATLRERPAGLIQLVLTVPVFWFQPPALSRSLRLCS